MGWWGGGVVGGRGMDDGRAGQLALVFTDASAPPPAPLCPRLPFPCPSSPPAARQRQVTLRGRPPVLCFSQLRAQCLSRQERRERRGGRERGMSSRKAAAAAAGAGEEQQCKQRCSQAEKATWMRRSLSRSCPSMNASCSAAVAPPPAAPGPPSPPPCALPPPAPPALHGAQGPASQTDTGSGYGAAMHPFTRGRHGMRAVLHQCMLRCINAGRAPNLPGGSGWLAGSSLNSKNTRW